MVLCKVSNHILIDGLDKSRVDNCTGNALFFQCFPHLYRSLSHAADRKQGNLFFFEQHLTLAHFNVRTLVRQPVIRLAAGIPDCDRSFEIIGKLHHIGKFPFVFGRHDVHIRDGR